MSHKEQTSSPEDGPPTTTPYTIFTRSQRIYFTYLLGYLTLASSLTATIYFPLIKPLSDEYHVSIQDINLTITLYVAFQAIAPCFFAPLSDTLGRRPVLLVTFTVYSAASLGLALNKHSYVALLLLRALQSIGGSAVMSLAYAIVADISVPAERGKILGPMLAATNLGPCFGPVIGGGIVYATGKTAWCFWTLVVFGGSALMMLGWTMPETGRAVVGNGEVPARGIWRTWWAVAWSLRKASTSDSDADSEQPDNYSTEAAPAPAPAPNHSSTIAINTNNPGPGTLTLTLPNPLTSLRILVHPDTFLTLYCAASPYAVWYSIQTSIPLIYRDVYGYNDLTISLCFLSGGAGVILGGLVAGRLMDYNYRKVAGREGRCVDRVKGDDLRGFPIEKARARGAWVMHSVGMAGIVGYGWAVQSQSHVHPSIPLLLQVLIGAKCTVILQLFSTLIVDVFPERAGAAAAAAANNIMRCALSAALVALLDPLDKAMGRGWMFTLIGLVDGLSGLVAVWVLGRWGFGWRGKRESKRQGADDGGEQRVSEPV
jgi:MFS family permease